MTNLTLSNINDFVGRELGETLALLIPGEAAGAGGPR
jgi:hypothetical protein